MVARQFRNDVGLLATPRGAARPFVEATLRGTFALRLFGSVERLRGKGVPFEPVVAIIRAVLRFLLIALAAGGLVWAAPRLVDGALSVAHDDQVHYGGHLLAGRILSLCPCTTQLAEIQYFKGRHHARTPRQAALLTSERPSSMRARLAEAPVLAAGALRHVASRLTA